MNAKLCLLLFFTCLLQMSKQDEEKTHKVVVLEMGLPLNQQNAISSYMSLIEYASLVLSSDIIVFPEGSLTLKKESASPVPDPEDKIIPYKDDSNNIVIRKISEAAAKNKIYAVVNIFERVNCSNDEKDCPEKGYFLYNTNVVFDRRGAVVARYRKINVYDEENVDRPKTKELSTFTTDFGVTFGLFTCFDILFKTPALDLVNEKHVKNFIFPSRWYGELPFLTAVQVQAGWSYANNVTLLAAGVNKPTVGSSGSGFYVGRQYTHSVMYEKEGTMLLYEGLKSKPAQNFNRASGEARGLKLLEDPSVPSAEKKSLNLNDRNFKGKVCYNGLCCTFDITYGKSYKENSKNYTYNVLAFQGERRFGKNFTHDVAYCALVLCTSGNCAKKPLNTNFPLVFEKIKIETEFEGKDSFLMPTTLVAKKDEENASFFNTMDSNSYMFDSKKIENSEKYLAKMELLRENAPNIFTFGIFIRKFD